VNAEQRVLAVLEQVQRTRTEWIFDPRAHTRAVLFQFGLPGDHGGWRRPGRPLRFAANVRCTGPSEPVTAHAYPVTHRKAAFLHEVKKPGIRIDDDGAGWMLGRVADASLDVFRVNRFCFDRRNFECAVGKRGILGLRGRRIRRLLERRLIAGCQQGGQSGGAKSAQARMRRRTECG